MKKKETNENKGNNMTNKDFAIRIAIVLVAILVILYVFGVGDGY